MAWAHHHNRNPHHWLYWVDFSKENKITPMRIPYKYAIEAIADWIGAGMTYTGKDFNWSEPYEYYKANTRVNANVNIHFSTIQLWDTILVDLMLYGIDHTAKKIRRGDYEDIYKRTVYFYDEPVIFNLVQYKKLCEKYYN